MGATGRLRGNRFPRNGRMGTKGTGDGLHMTSREGAIPSARPHFPEIDVRDIGAFVCHARV
jgi:hypothetical protein